MTEKKRKYNRRAQLRLRRIIVLCVLALILVGLIFGAVKLCASCKTSASKRSLPFSSSDNFAYTGGGFLYAHDKKLSYLDIGDESKSFTVDLEESGAGVAGSDRIKVVYSATSLQVVGTPYEHTFEGAIKKIVCCGKYVGAYIENADNTHSLAVYNSAGDRRHLAELGSSVLLDFGFEGGDSSAMYMSELVTIGTAVSTTVTTLDLARESITGVMNIQGEIAKNIIMTSKSVFIFGTDSLIRFDRSTNTEAYRLLSRNYDCLDHSADGGRLMLLLAQSGEKSAPLRVLSVKEAEAADDSVLELPSASRASSCFLMRGKVVSVNGTTAEIRSMKGELSASIPLGTEVVAAEKLDESRLLLFSGDEPTLLTLKNF
ncbi:MAG: hypothetical protein IKZ82_05090 [Clostridia bacterium]|nr:hypothetical protein [Clostridia bacterium]